MEGGGRTECIFMSLRLSSFWVIWLHGHKFWAPTFLGVSLQCTLIQLVCKLFLQSSLRSPLLFRYFSTLSTFWSADLFLHHLSLSCPPPPPPFLHLFLFMVRRHYFSPFCYFLHLPPHILSPAAYRWRLTGGARHHPSS